MVLLPCAGFVFEGRKSHAATYSILPSHNKARSRVIREILMVREWSFNVQFPVVPLATLATESGRLMLSASLILPISAKLSIISEPYR